MSVDEIITPVTQRQLSPYAMATGIMWAVAAVLGWLSLSGLVALGVFVLCESIAFGLIWPTAALTRPGLRWLGVLAGLFGFWTAGVQTAIGDATAGLVLAVVTVVVGLWMLTTRSPFARWAAGLAVASAVIFVGAAEATAGLRVAPTVFAAAVLIWLAGTRFVRGSA